MIRLGYPRYVAQGGDGCDGHDEIGLRDRALRGIHLICRIVAPDPETMSSLTPPSSPRSRAWPRRVGLGIRAAERAAADLGYGLSIRPRARRVNPREVLEMDRLQRPSRERASRDDCSTT
jgi:hypothetical protein